MLALLKIIYAKHFFLKNKTNRLCYLEGIRGIAAFIVLIGHLKNVFDYDFENRTLAYFINLTHSTFLGTLLNSFIVVFVDGKLAVQIFWFMSAYVISIKLFGKHGSTYLKSAVIKRYFRLAIPVLASVLLAFGLMKLGFMYNHELEQFSGRHYPSLTEMYNFKPDFLKAIKSGLWDTFFNFKSSNSYNIVLWTMEPELFGSFFCFFLFAVFRKGSARYYFYVCFIIASVFFQYYWLTTFIISYILCDIDHTTNPFKKMLATLSAHLYAKWYYSVAVIFILIMINGLNQHFYSAYAKIFVSAGIVFSVMNAESLRNFFSKKILVWLGKISFGLYLIHIPVIYSFSCYLYLQIGLEHICNAWISSIITIAFVLTGAVIFTKFIDKQSVFISSKIAKFFVR